MPNNFAPLPVYLTDNNGNVWLLQAAANGAPQTVGPLPPPYATPPVASVILNDTEEAVTWSLFVLPSAALPAGQAGVLQWAAIPSSAGPTSLLVGSPTPSVYELSIINGDLTSTLGSFSLQYYLDLYTSEYKLSTNLLAWTQFLLTPLLDAAQCAVTMSEFFDLNMAVGVQLDTLGQIIGRSRTVGFTPSGGVSPVLDDATYRTLLKATVEINHWDGQADSLYPIWNSIFPGGRITIIDNQNMTATVSVGGSFTSILQDLISNGYIVPRPQAVQYTYTFATLPIFGVDRNDAFIAGVDLGHVE